MGFNGLAAFMMSRKGYGLDFASFSLDFGVLRRFGSLGNKKTCTGI